MIIKNYVFVNTSLQSIYHQTARIVLYTAEP